MAWPRHFFSVSVGNLLFLMVHSGVLQLILVASALAERCTKAVPVKTAPVKKVQVLRRIPAACSQWDKYWTWITHKDCGTKYRLEYVTEHPSKAVQYRLEYVCCDGDTECEEAENIHSSGFNSTDEKFLAIILGSTAAVAIIIIIIVAISFCTKKRRVSSAREHGHVYNRAEAEDSQEGGTTEEKCRLQDRESDGDCKPGEPEYAEIDGPALPRYTDLFSAKGEDLLDPFSKATAPPIYSGNRPATGRNTGATPYCNTKENEANNCQITRSAPNEATYAKVSKQQQSVTNQPPKSLSTTPATATTVTETRYYNVREKKKKKKRNGQGVKGEKKDGVRSTRKPRVGNNAVAVEMMVKSCSASETIGASTATNETSLIKQKRRSAPPDTSDLTVIGVVHSERSPNMNKPAPPFNTSSGIPAVPLPETPAPIFAERTPAPVSQSGPKSPKSPKSMKSPISSVSSSQSPTSPKSPQSPKSKTGAPKKSSAKDKAARKERQARKELAAQPNKLVEPSPMTMREGRPAGSEHHQHRALPSTTAPSSEARPKGLQSIQSQPPLASEKDSSLPSPSYYSGFDATCPECTGYDTLQYTRDTDESDHIYERLDKVKRQCQDLHPKTISSPASSPTSSTSPLLVHTYANGATSLMDDRKNRSVVTEECHVNDPGSAMC